MVTRTLARHLLAAAIAVAAGLVAFVGVGSAVYLLLYLAGVPPQLANAAARMAGLVACGMVAVGGLSRRVGGS